MLLHPVVDQLPGAVDLRVDLTVTGLGPAARAVEQRFETARDRADAAG